MKVAIAVQYTDVPWTPSPNSEILTGLFRAFFLFGLLFLFFTFLMWGYLLIPEKASVDPGVLFSGLFSSVTFTLLANDNGEKYFSG